MESIDLGACRASVFGADPSRVAVILPGKVYPITAPVLWFASKALLAAGWTVLGAGPQPSLRPGV